MSGTLGGVYNSVTWAISEHSKALANLQEQASTGKRINRVSDSPAESHRIIGLKTEFRQKQGYASAVHNVYDFVNTASMTLGHISDKMTKQREQLTSALSAVHEADLETRKNFAEGVDFLLEDMVMLANTLYKGQYIFGGSDSSNQPYRVTREDGQIVGVEYRGSDEERMVEIGEGMEIGLNMVGEDIFSLDSPGQVDFHGNTGAAAGTGTPSIKGNAWLDIEAEAGGYKLSIDGGKSWVSVAVPPGEENTVVTNADTGKVLFVDTRNITQEGSEAVKVRGTYNLFNQLIEIRDLFVNKRNLPEEDRKLLAETAINDFMTLHVNITKGFTLLGTKMNSLDNIKESMEDASFNLEEGIINLEQADIAQISTDLARRETLYEMSLIVASKLFRLSILNYMQ